jgi:hypothetical protein
MKYQVVDGMFISFSFMEKRIDEMQSNVTQ